MNLGVILRSPLDITPRQDVLYLGNLDDISQRSSLHGVLKTALDLYHHHLEVLHKPTPTGKPLFLLLEIFVLADSVRSVCDLSRKDIRALHLKPASDIDYHKVMAS